MKKLAIIILLVLLRVSISNAQVVLPLGSGQTNSLNVTCSNNDKLWVVSKEQGNFVINKWDGNFWLPYRTIPTNLFNEITTNLDSISAKAIFYYQNELYAAFAHNVTGELLVIKSTGKKWDRINTDGISVEKTIEFLDFDNKLLLCGKITVDNLLVSILNIKASTCEVYASNPAYMGINDYYTDFETNDNKIWAIGLFATPTDPYNRYFTVLDAGTWKVVTNPPYNNGFEGFGKYNNRLIVTGRDFDGKISFSLQNSSLSAWDEISNGLNDWTIKSVSDFLQVGSNLWVSGNFVNNNTAKKSSFVFWDGKSWFVPEIDYLGSDILLNGLKQIYITGSFINHQGLVLNKTGVLGFNYAIIAGKVYDDHNQNCTQDSGEPGLQGVVVKLLPNNIFLTTDFEGRYYFPVDSSVKEHFVELQVPKYHLATCGSMKYVRHFSELTIAGIDFGIMPEADHSDAAIHLSDFTGWRARQGFEERYNLCATNTGSKSLLTGKMILKSDNRLSNWTFSVAPDNAVNNTFEWTLPALKSNEKYCVIGSTTIPMSISLGDKIKFETNVLITDIQDEDLSDNTFVLSEKIVAGIDPNDKTTLQEPKILPGTSEIDYKIRFQNTGSDTAYNILITDTLDPHFFISSKGIFWESSHPEFNLAGTAWLENGNYRYRYAIRLPDIKLPDDKTNEVSSHGYISFHINLSKGLELGTTIKNRGYIHFDYQEPILTNIATNFVTNDVGTKTIVPNSPISIFPNPAQDQITILNPLKTSLPFTIINSCGQVVMSQTINADSSLILPTNGLSKGLYLVRFENFVPVKLILK